MAEVAKGRPRGSVTKSTERIKNFIVNFLEDNLDQFKEDYTQLDEKERARTYIKMCEFVVPKGLALSGLDNVTVTIQSKLKSLAEEEVAEEEGNKWEDD